MDINMELYKVFYYVAKTGSISKASKELFISQPAVSQSVKQLEDKLQGQLFFRTSRGANLTKEGEVLYQYIEQAMNFIFMAEDKYKELQNLMSGEIKIGASDTICKYYLAPYLEIFNEKYPNIHIHITNRTTVETINLLKSGNADIGFINIPIKPDPSLIIKEALTLQDCFVAGEKYKHLCDSTISVNDLANYPVLLLERGSSIRHYIDEYAKNNKVKLSPEIELGSIDLLVQFAKIGLGISCVIKNFIEEELTRGELYEIKLTEKIPERKIGIISLKNVPPSMVAKKFMELLKIDI